jgi:hypothetical protein
MKRKYNLSDIGKALRVCLMYAASLEADAAAALTGEVHAAKDAPTRGREEADWALRPEQRAWLAGATARCGAPDESSFLRWLLDGLIDTAPEEPVFTVVRCSTTKACCKKGA